MLQSQNHTLRASDVESQKIFDNLTNQACIDQ